MSRVPIAVVGGLVGLAAYIGAAATLADRLAGMHWAVQGLYYALAGSLWVFPVRWLMLWAARMR